MTKDDIIRMAREAGFFPDWNWDRTNWHATGYSDSFEHLVELARAAEREACAKVCDVGVDTEHPTVKGHIMKNFGASPTLAAAIRARGQK